MRILGCNVRTLPRKRESSAARSPPRYRPPVTSRAHGFEEGVGALRVELFVCPHEGYEIFGFREIDDIMRIAGQHMDRLDPIAGDFKFEDFVGADLTLLDQPVT